MAGDHLVVLCSVPDRNTATELASALVEQRLAACATILPGVVSIYRWQDKVEAADELILLIKTAATAYDALEEALRRLHPYELPEVIAVPIDRGLPAYLAWVDESLRTPE